MDTNQLEAVKAIVDMFSGASVYALVAFIAHLLVPLVSTGIKVVGAVMGLKIVVKGIFKDAETK